MSKDKLIENGSVVQWIDKETLKYSQGEFTALVWVDFEPGFFTNGRIIKTSSIKKWETSPAGYSDEIDKKTREKIIHDIQLYYKSLKKKCRVEE